MKLQKIIKLNDGQIVQFKLIHDALLSQNESNFIDIYINKAHTGNKTAKMYRNKSKYHLNQTKEK